MDKYSISVQSQTEVSRTEKVSVTRKYAPGFNQVSFLTCPQVDRNDLLSGDAKGILIKLIIPPKEKKMLFQLDRSESTDKLAIFHGSNVINLQHF